MCYAKNCDEFPFFSSIIVKGLITVRKEIPMDDQQILDLYWTRSETALSETAAKYGRYCHYIAYNILRMRTARSVSMTLI